MFITACRQLFPEVPLVNASFRNFEVEVYVPFDVFITQFARKVFQKLRNNYNAPYKAPTLIHYELSDATSTFYHWEIL